MGKLKVLIFFEPLAQLVEQRGLSSLNYYELFRRIHYEAILVEEETSL